MPSGASTARPLRVALIGYGLAGRFFHRPLVSATPGMAVAAVVTADAERRAQAHREIPDAVLLASADELWAEAASYDLAVVATTTGTHAALAQAALAAGLPVVVDKPLAPTRAEGAAVAEAAERAALPVVPFHNRRWDADHLTLRRLLADQTLGTVLRYESRFERWRPEASASPGAWRETLPAAAGGGVLLDLGVHLVDQALTLFGPVSLVYAEVEARRGGADDDVFVALEHAGGVHSHLWAGALAAAPGPRLRVLGTDGAFVHGGLDGQEAALRGGMHADAPDFGVEPPERWGRLASGPAGRQRPVPSERGDWPAFYAGMARTLRSGVPAPVPLADALAVLAVLDAARESAASGETWRL